MLARVVMNVVFGEVDDAPHGAEQGRTLLVDLDPVRGGAEGAPTDVVGQDVKLAHLSVVLGGPYFVESERADPVRGDRPGLEVAVVILEGVDEHLAASRFRPGDRHLRCAAPRRVKKSGSRHASAWLVCRSRLSALVPERKDFAKTSRCARCIRQR